MSLNDELARRQVRGEAYLAGGAVMCLVFRARPATKDIDAMLVPSADLRAAAQAVADREGLSSDWLNDAVKGFFSERGAFAVFEELSHLRIYVPHPGYLLAMKCLSLRLGEEFLDLQDISVLLRELGLRTVTETESILGEYYDLARYPAKRDMCWKNCWAGVTPRRIDQQPRSPRIQKHNGHSLAQAP